MPEELVTQFKETYFESPAGKIAVVTMDNGEWVYGRAYAYALNAGDTELMRRIGEDYVRYMLAIVEFWEGQTVAIVGRPIPHILLIHAYALNADWLGTLLTALEDRGYAWISLEEAMEDPVYDRPVHGWCGRGGISWLHRWAIMDAIHRRDRRGQWSPRPNLKCGLKRSRDRKRTCCT